MSTMSHAEIAALIFEDMSPDLIFYPLSEIAHALDLIHDYDPNAIGFMEQALTTGPKAARSAAAYKIAAITENIAEARETGESWQERCSRTLGSDLINAVMTAWGVECVSSEYKGVEEYRIVMWAEKARFILRNDDLGLDQYPVSFEDWRGVAVLGAVRVSGAPTQLKAFIRYAGTAKNIAAVIDTARARNTLNPDTIEAVINGSDSSSLMSGAL